MDASSQTSLLTTITLLISQVTDEAPSFKERILASLVNTLQFSFSLVSISLPLNEYTHPCVPPSHVLHHQTAIINLFRSLLLSPTWSSLTQTCLLDLITTSSLYSQLAVTSILGGDILGLHENGEALYRRKRGEHGSPVERCIISTIHETESRATIVVNSTGGFLFHSPPQ